MPINEKKNSIKADAQPAVKQAMDFITNNIETGLWLKGSKIPGITQLTKSTNLSRMTIWRAIKILEKKGLLKITHGSGIYVPHPEGEDPIQVDQLSRGKWLRVKAKILNDIFTGTYSALKDMLPSSKEMMLQYGVNYRTLRKVLSSLCQDNVVAPSKGRYQIIGARQSMSISPLILITEDDFFLNLSKSYYQARAGMFLTHLEKECNSRRVVLNHLSYSEARAAKIDFNQSLGVVLWVPENSQDPATDLLSTLERVTPPVFVVDLAGNMAAKQKPHYGQNRFFFRTADKLAGLLTGRHLMEMGHKKIAFFSVANSDWSLNRYRGLMQAWQDGGRRPEDLVLFRSCATSQNRDRNRLLLEFQNQAKCLEKVKREIEKGLPESVLKEKLVHQIMITRGDLMFSMERMLECFEKAISVPDITAWVADSDKLAINAMGPFLKQKGGEVLDRISVASFENSIEMVIESLTTIDFNYQSLIPKIFNIIQYPKQRALAAKLPQPIDIECQLINRSSVNK